MSPPKAPISFTKREEMNWKRSEAIRNTVSIFGLRRAFIPAIWNSYSKSETARGPRGQPRPASLVGVAVAVPFVAFRQPRNRNDPLAVADLKYHDTGAAAARDADVVHRHPDHHAAIGHQHQLVVMADREDRDHG